MLEMQPGDYAALVAGTVGAAGTSGAKFLGEHKLTDFSFLTDFNPKIEDLLKLIYRNDYIDVATISFFATAVICMAIFRLLGLITRRQ